MRYTMNNIFGSFNKEYSVTWKEHISGPIQDSGQGKELITWQNLDFDKSIGRFSLSVCLLTLKRSQIERNRHQILGLASLAEYLNVFQILCV